MGHVMAHSHGTPASIVFLAGISAGALAALLFAPRAGNETRRQLKDAAMNARRKAQETVEEQKIKAEVAVDTAKDKANDMMEEGAQALDKAADKTRKTMPQNP